jgi:pyruvate dehydrogenase E2 component (dihydrolipoamide acetyltransferase)
VELTVVIVVAMFCRLQLASEKGIDISALTGTGPRGRVIAADVQEAAPGIRVAAAAPGVQQVQAAPAAQRPISIGGVYEDFILDDASRQLAARLTAAKQTVPHYHLSVDLNLDNLLQGQDGCCSFLAQNFGSPAHQLTCCFWCTVRDKLNKGILPEEQISVQDIIAKAAAAAMRQVPDVNSSWMDSFVRRYEQVDINFVVGSGSGKQQQQQQQQQKDSIMRSAADI